jgi:hypothetical protein
MSRKREDDVLLRDYLTDSEALGLVVDAVIAGSKPIKKLSKRLLKAQRKLRGSVNGKAWKTYLALEELTNERADMQVDLIVKWAFTAGARRR